MVAEVVKNAPQSIPVVRFLTKLKGSHPTALGSYEIVDILGYGGTSIVYEGVNRRLGLTRAIKLLIPTKINQLSVRFESEISVSAQLRHPNIVDVYSFGEWKGLPFIEMEKIEGIGLERVLKDRPVIPFAVVTAIGIMVCRALHYAHTSARGHDTVLDRKFHGVVHNDIKPSNIMLLHSGVVKLIDFGIAQPFSRIDKKNITNDDVMLMGTMQYIAPEQINGLNIDHRTDIYSFGVVLYEMVTGGKAFPEANLIHLLNNINRNCYEPIRSLRPQTPKALCALIEQCMQLDRSDRIQNVSELLHRLEAIHKNLITRSDPVTVVKNYLKKDKADFDNSLLPSARRRMMYYGSVIFPVLACVTGLLIRLPDNHSSLPIQSANSVQPSPATVPVRQLSTKPPENIRGEQEQTIEQPPSASEVSKSPAARSGTSSIASAKNGNKRPDKEAAPHRVRAARQDSKTETRAITPDTNAPHPVSDNTSDWTTDKGYLLQLREATQNNALDELERLLSQRELDDGEYYLYKARYKIIRGELSKIEPLIQKAQTAPCRVMEPEKRDIEVLYTRARYLSLVFDHEQNKTNSVAAMEAWYTVKYQFRNTPSHAYFIKADMEIRRISDTIQNM